MAQDGGGKVYGIPTDYGGTRFRSRLEARWAAFFDLIGWRWTYEPCDLAGWIPDFLIHGFVKRSFQNDSTSPFLVEVKPCNTVKDLVLTCDEKVQKANPRTSVLLVGVDPRTVKFGRCPGWGTPADDEPEGSYDGKNWPWAKPLGVGVEWDQVDVGPVDGVPCPPDVSWEENGVTIGWWDHLHWSLGPWARCEGSPVICYDQGQWERFPCGHTGKSDCRGPDNATRLYAFLDNAWRHAGNRVQWRRAR